MAANVMLQRYIEYRCGKRDPGVQLFLEELKSGKSTPLKDVTSGYHYHTVSADSGETLDLIGQELGKKGYLCQ